MSQEFQAVMRVVWAAVTVAMAAAVLVPLVVPERTIAAIVPPCESKRLTGRECILCGTTTGFIAIAHGEWAEAARANRLAIPLYAAFSLNTLAAIAYFSTRRPRTRLAR